MIREKAHLHKDSFAFAVRSTEESASREPAALMSEVRSEQDRTTIKTRLETRTGAAPRWVPRAARSFSFTKSLNSSAARFAAARAARIRASAYHMVVSSLLPDLSAWIRLRS